MHHPGGGSVSLILLSNSWPAFCSVWALTLKALVQSESLWICIKSKAKSEKNSVNLSLESLSENHLITFSNTFLVRFSPERQKHFWAKGLQNIVLIFGFVMQPGNSYLFEKQIQKNGAILSPPFSRHKSVKSLLKMATKKYFFFVKEQTFRELVTLFAE